MIILITSGHFLEMQWPFCVPEPDPSIEIGPYRVTTLLRDRHLCVSLVVFNMAFQGSYEF